jgi:endonuclease III
MHALLVRVGKDHCYKSAPNCDACPLQKFLPEGRAVKRPLAGARDRRR